MKGYKVIQFFMEEELYNKVQEVKGRRSWVQLLKDEVLKEKDE